MSNRFIVTDFRSDVIPRVVPRPRNYLAAALKIAALVVFYVACMATTPARADSVTTTCYHNHYIERCTTTRHADPAPFTYTAEEIAAIKARDDEWNTYCKPHDMIGTDGLLRAVYAHKDCDIGVYQPGKRSE